MKSQKLISSINLSKGKFLIIIILAFMAGYIIRGSIDKKVSSEKQGHNHISESSEYSHQQWWTCSMHPQIRQPKSGKCPICFMDLIPITTQTIEIGERQIAFSEDALKLMEIQTTPAERKFVEAEIRMVGTVDYDETKVKNIAAWVPGRIDRLYVDFTGTRVSKGDHMVYLYSPELLSSQAELLQAVKAARNLKAESSELIKQSTLATLDSAREKLRLLGLQKRQIDEIEKTGQATDHITIYAPIGGIVIKKYATEGMYVDTGTIIYTIADLSEVWIKLDAYESDIMWIRYGQEVEFVAEAYPGEIFKGRISFIDPVLNPKTRTVRLRVNVHNKDGRLKPDMFVRAIVHSKLAKAGLVMEVDMAGKWICPMHPAVVKQDKGLCDICGMDLVTTESLGYVKADEPDEAPLVIPASAPLITGKRAVVYVRLPNTEKPTFEGREVVLGPRAGNYYLVESGLHEGELVVTNGNFKIDSALQIQAKPSMMNPQGQKVPMKHSENSH
jgi:Cu(I)/Ag(I) efflux system membrane fusion protein